MNFYVERSSYSSDAEGRLEVAPEHVAAMVRMGCERPEPPKVRLRAKPHSAFQPRTGFRYQADSDGIILAHRDDVAALLRAGCERA
jgi:hypothetical protein